MLYANDVHAGYDGSVVLEGLSIEVHAEESVALLGGNGVGKTTLMRVLSGLLKPYSGGVKFDGEDITGMAPYALAKRGLVLVPETRRIFPSMTVLENLQMGAYHRRRNKSQVQADLDVVREAFPRLKDRHAQLGGTLSGGEQQMLAIARGLMSRPKLLLLDEPSLGLAPLLVEQVFDRLLEVNKAGTTILLIEQNVSLALEIADRGYVMSSGRTILEGTSAELTANEEVQRAYLGGAEAEVEGQ